MVSCFPTSAETAQSHSARLRLAQARLWGYPAMRRLGADRSGQQPRKFASGLKPASLRPLFPGLKAGAFSVVLLRTSWPVGINTTFAFCLPLRDRLLAERARIFGLAGKDQSLEPDNFCA
jgi:hypothetical protein